MASTVARLLPRARRATVFLSVAATLASLIASSPPASAAGPASVSITPESATTESGVAATFALTISCSVTGGCSGTTVTFPTDTVTGNGDRDDFGAWVGNSSCAGVTRQASAGQVTFTYGTVPTGTMQCTFPVAPPNYTTLNGAKLTITLDEQGNVGLEGPVDQKMLCYGMLETARDLIQDYHIAKEQSAIQRPSPADVLSLNGHHRKG